MKNKNVFIYAFGFLIICLVGFLSLRFFYKNGLNSNSQVNNSQPGSESSVMMREQLLVKPHSAVKGPSSAEVTLVEFLDPECESCAAMYPVVQKIFNEYQDKIKVVIRYMPYHPNSKYVANILEGTKEQGKYWETLEVLFKNQELWGDHHNPQPENIPQVLNSLKLNDFEKILTEARAGKFNKIIEEDFMDGKALGVTGTPTFFVNGQMVEELSYEGIKVLLDKELTLLKK